MFKVLFLSNRRLSHIRGKKKAPHIEICRSDAAGSSFDRHSGSTDEARIDPAESDLAKCAINIAQVSGNVEVKGCGLPPRALNLLEHELTSKRASLDAARNEARQWQGKYEELRDSIASTSLDPAIQKKALSLVNNGRFDEAEKLLLNILPDQEKQVDAAAQTQSQLGSIYELQFRFDEALKHDELAYQYRSANVVYAFNYGAILQNKQRTSKALQVFEQLLKQTSPEIELTRISAATLGNLAVLYERLGSIDKAQEADSKAIALLTNPAFSCSDEDESNLAFAYTGGATIALERYEFQSAERDFRQALTILRTLAQRNPPLYQTKFSDSMNNLASVYLTQGVWNMALSLLKEAETIRMKLVSDDSRSESPKLAATYVNEGIAYFGMKQYEAAESADKAAIKLDEVLSHSDPGRFQADLAKERSALGDAYLFEGHSVEAEQSYDAALSNYRSGGEFSSATDRYNVATTLNNLASIYVLTGRAQKALDAFLEEATIDRELAHSGATRDLAALSNTLHNLANTYTGLGQTDKAREAVAEQREVQHRLSH